ncbi:sugar phosphate nucleotidyltransferase [Gramella sp. AN32]|uniref:Sugar phosphate nucleotidyltransferase n=1 Tax=Christiangramia antarctica TaxID=2058158 RepID=A0ABW5X5V2_9FLAO|nr:sugar phosphate nucleotidyltransferase [Gramella sp. AN32]MCM4156695.1 UTP--glucose-1-phosphate uridylyltransferase [Gramella sp. AN32]
MTLLLMAGGRGSRYGKLKQFDGLGPNEEFLMEYSIKDAIRNGFDHIVVITQEANADFLKGYFEIRLPENVQFEVVVQEIGELPADSSIPVLRTKPLGTAHAVWCARNVIDEPFAVINADDYYGTTAFKEVARRINKTRPENEFLFMGYLLKNTLSPNGVVARGVCKLNNDNSLANITEYKEIEAQENRIIDIESQVEFTGDEIVSMNFWVCQPAIFPFIEKEIRSFLNHKQKRIQDEIYLPFIIQKMLEENAAKVTVIPTNENWFGVTYASDKDKVVDSLAEMTRKKIYPNPLW